MMLGTPSPASSIAVAGLPWVAIEPPGDIIIEPLHEMMLSSIVRSQDCPYVRTYKLAKKISSEGRGDSVHVEEESAPSGLEN